MKEQIHTVSSYDRELELLNNSIIQMGRLVNSMVDLAGLAMQNCDKNYVDEARETDKKINELDYKIEKQCVSIIALRQPMAIDLRIVITALRLAVIMERMGDLSKNVVKRAAKMKNPPSKLIMNKFDKMCNIVSHMLAEVLKCYEKRDDKRALFVCEKDNEVDELYKVLIVDIQGEMAQEKDNLESATHFLYSIKNIERIGDYVTKVAVQLHYIVTGETPPELKKNKNI
jgi:phosphate transport system protein